MGLFDIFKTETKATTLEDLSCISINEWDDGYTDTDTLVIDFIKKKIESMSYEKFISFLKKRDKYLKVTDEELNNEEKYSMNKIKLKGEINSFFPYPRHFLNADPKMWESGIKSYRIIESRERYIPERAGGKGRETGNFKCLQILTIDNQMNKYPCDKSTRDLSIQFVDLDDDDDLEIMGGSGNNLAVIDVKENGSNNNYWHIFRGNNLRNGFAVLDESECGADLGNVNGDNEINILDLVQIANLILEISTPEFECAADYTQNGEVNILDLVQIANLILDI